MGWHLSMGELELSCQLEQHVQKPWGGKRLGSISEALEELAGARPQGGEESDVRWGTEDHGQP